MLIIPFSMQTTGFEIDTDHTIFQLILEVSYIQNTCFRRNVSKHFETFTKCVVANPIEFERKINAIVDYHLKKVLKNKKIRIFKMYN